MLMGKRADGEGSWGTKVINGHEYKVFRIRLEGVGQKSFYGKTKKEALDKYKKFLNTPEMEKKTQKDTFYNYCHTWLFEFKKDKIKPKTFDYYDFIIETYIRNTRLGNYSVKKINLLTPRETHKLIQNHFNIFMDKSKSTLDGLYTVLNQVCKHGLVYNDFSHNYMLGIDKVSEKSVGTKKREVTALTYEEVMKLWDEMMRMNTEGNIVNNKAGTYVYGIGAPALLFCCFTGLRWGEVSRLEWQDIKEENGNFYFKVDKQFVTIKDRSNSDNSYMTISAEPKSEKSERYIPLSNKALDLLRFVKERFPECCSLDHLIFSTTNNPYSASTANRLLKAMCIRAGVPEISPHALRHSFASILLNEDEKNLYTVSDLLGHSSTDVTYKKYIDIFEKNKVNTISIFDKF